MLQRHVSTPIFTSAHEQKRPESALGVWNPVLGANIMGCRTESGILRRDCALGFREFWRLVCPLFARVFEKMDVHFSGNVAFLIKQTLQLALATPFIAAQNAIFQQTVTGTPFAEVSYEDLTSVQGITA
jgi:hypothetical protein